MSRPLRIEFPGAIYHVTSRGNARQKIYRNNEDREKFLSVLAQVVKRYGWLCHAYCLMDNHYHLLIETPRANLSIGTRQLNGVYTQGFNRRHRRVGHLFQGRFKSILVEKESHLLELCRYVVLNPVRAHMVQDPGKWRWSSYRATAGLGNPAEGVSIDWILGQFGRRYKESRKRYRDFVREGMKAPSPWEGLRGQIYLGSEDFVLRNQPDKLIGEVPRQQTQTLRPRLEKLFKGGRDRREATGEAYSRYGYRMKEIAGHLGVHYATVSRWLKKSEFSNV